MEYYCLLCLCIYAGFACLRPQYMLSGAGRHDHVYYPHLLLSPTRTDNRRSAMGSHTDLAPRAGELPRQTRYPALTERLAAAANRAPAADGTNDAAWIGTCAFLQTGPSNFMFELHTYRMPGCNYPVNAKVIPRYRLRSFFKIDKARLKCLVWNKLCRYCNTSLAIHSVKLTELIVSYSSYTFFYSSETTVLRCFDDCCIIPLWYIPSGR